MNSRKRPPRLIRWLLSRLTLYEINHSILGDFEESYNTILRQKGSFRARLWYISQVLRSLPYYFGFLLSTGLGLLFNYVKLSLRNFRRHRFYTVINITGLSIGLAAVIITFLYIRFEMSFDRYHPGMDRIYRIVTETFTGTPYILGESIHGQIPEIEELVRIKDVTSWGPIILTAETKKVTEKKLFAADPSLFKIFAHRFISGNPDTALSHPASLVLTESAAVRYFGQIDPIGKTVTIRGSPLQVTAVIADIPPNSHLHFNALVPVVATANNRWGGDDLATWTSSNYVTYFKLKPNTQPGNMEQRLTAAFRQGRKDGSPLSIQALKTIHLHSHLRGEFEANSDIRNLRFAAIIAIVLLLIAILNFMNLASAHSLRRGREVGMRKVLGARRGQLVRQFIGEAMAFVAIAAVLALFVANSLLPVFQQMTGSSLDWSYIPLGLLILFLGGIILLAGIAAGSYPAFFAAGFQPIAVLSSIPKLGLSRRFSLRNFLVGVQFIISIFFVCTSLIVTSQMRYMKNTQLGRDSEHILIIELPREARHLHQTFKTGLLRHPGIISASSSDFLPSQNSQNIGSTWEGRLETEDIYLAKINVDADFITTFGIEVIAGEAFASHHRPGAAYIVNETAARLIGKGRREDALGKILHMGTWSSQPERIVGIVKDFHFRSLHRSIEPMVLVLQASREVKRPGTGTMYKLEPFKFVSLKIAPGYLKDVLKEVKTMCREFISYSPEPWSFYDQDFGRMYAAEQITSRFLMILAFTAVSLAGMGLLGLSIYTVANRRKEIGIRRVMGASAVNILLLFFRDLFRIHLIAALIAVPLVYYFMYDWLNNFAYRIHLGPAVFLSGVAITALLFFAISSLNVLKHASTNPAESLRHE